MRFMMMMLLMMMLQQAGGSGMVRGAAARVCSGHGGSGKL